MANETGTETLCKALDADVVVNTTSRSIGTVVHASCKKGFRLEGSDTLECEYTGYWSLRQPFCISEGDSHLVVIIISALASAVALGVLICGLCMLFSSMKKDKHAKAQAKNFKETMKEISIYHAVTQDCVGMPAVIYDNVNAQLRGRTSSTDDSKASSPAPNGEEADLAREKAFIF